MRRILSLPDWALALIAVVIFTLFEWVLKHSTVYMSVGIYLLIRLPVMCLFIYFFASRVFGTEYGEKIPTLNPCIVPFIHWVRASCWLTYIIMLAISMAVSSSQAFAYALFILHPCWTLLLAPYISESHVSWSGQFFPMVLTIVGCIIYVKYSPQEQSSGLFYADIASDFASTILPYVASLCGGIFFALTNILTQNVKKQTSHTSTTISFYSAYLSMFLIPVLWLLFTRPELSVFWVSSQRDETILMMLGLAGASVVVTIGTVFFTEAFRKAKDQSVIATMDLTIVLFAALLGLLTQEVSLFGGDDSLMSWRGFGLLLILIGAGLTLFQYQRRMGQG